MWCVLTETSELPSSAMEARRIGAKFYFTGRPCVRGNIALRLASANCCWCNACRTVKNEGATKDRQRNLRYERVYRERNADRIKARPVDREQANQRNRKWASKNRGYLLHKTALRRMAVKRATPPWADMDAILAVYEAAAARRRAGEDVHVDHVIPLQGKTVSGLHIAENLQIIPAIENLRKGNQIRALQAIVKADRK